MSDSDKPDSDDTRRQYMRVLEGATRSVQDMTLGLSARLDEERRDREAWGERLVEACSRASAVEMTDRLAGIAEQLRLIQVGIGEGLGVHVQRIDKHDREIEELRGEIARLERCRAGHDAQLIEVHRQLDFLMQKVGR